MHSFMIWLRLSRQRKECLWNPKKFYVNIRIAVRKTVYGKRNILIYQINQIFFIKNISEKYLLDMLIKDRFKTTEWEVTMGDLLKNGEKWFDTEGNILHAHGGYILFQDGVYYWYGENRLNNIYVSCYASTDLVHWEFRNHILTTESAVQGTRVRADLSLKNEKGGKVNLERPKVIYNKKTKKYVLWIHYENGINYHCASAAVATCDTPDGDFVYHGSFRPYGYMSRDCTLFQDEDGSAYFISAARENADIHIYKLQEDYLNIARLVNRLWQGEYREAPAVMKKDGVYYMMTSFCTGWAPNQGKYAYADSIEGEWSMLYMIGDKTTYRSQPAFILPVAGEKEVQYLYVGDRWGGEAYHESSYIFLPLKNPQKGELSLEWYPEIEIDAAKGSIVGKNI